MQTDFLVIGSGIAGLSYALKVAEKFPEKKIIILTKTTADETNTKYAQGGVAVVNDPEHDSFEKHIEDTLIDGDGLCNERIVEIVVKEGPDRVNEVIDPGPTLLESITTKFPRNNSHCMHYIHCFNCSFCTFLCAKLCATL